MEPMQASLNGTMRIILVLLAVWWVLRLIRRSRMASGGHRMVSPEQRTKGEVRIEPGAKLESDRRSPPTTSGTIIDADFEEIK
jgi:hypothetical protein